MRFSVITIVVFGLVTLMGNSASFAETSNNNQAQEKLLTGSWYMPEPIEETHQGNTISVSNGKISFLSDGTFEYSYLISLVSGNGIEGIRQSGTSLTYHIEVTGNWSLNDGVITSGFNEVAVTPDQSDIYGKSTSSQNFAASMRGDFLSMKPGKSELVLVSQNSLVIKDPVTGLVEKYTRVAD